MQSHGILKLKSKEEREARSNDYSNGRLSPYTFSTLCIKIPYLLYKNRLNTRAS